MEKTTKNIIQIIVLIGIGIAFGAFIVNGSNKPPVDKMTEGQLIDELRIVQANKDEQVNNLNMEDTMDFLQGDEQFFSDINSQISTLEDKIKDKQSEQTPKYEIIRQKFKEIQDQAVAKKKELEKTPSQLLDEGLGL